MTADDAPPKVAAPRDRRPKRFPPPEFPMHQPPRFAKTPPAIFPPILGLLGLALALRLGLAGLGLPLAAADLVAGVAVVIWGFAAFAYLAKLLRRPSVVLADLRVVPGRAGLAAMTMGAMAAASLLLPFSTLAAQSLVVAGLAGHTVLAVLLLGLLRKGDLPMPLNPSLHLSFVGFIVAAPAAIGLGWTLLATVLFWVMLAVALGIWGFSVGQALRALPPPPLRPMLAIHLSPVALLASVAGLLGMDSAATVLLVVGAIFAVILILAARWVCLAGISALWGAFTFPLAAFATAMLGAGGVWLAPGFGVAGVALVVNPVIAWWILKRWPGGKLAAVTNAAEA